jgi:hypothetical protein
MLAAVTSRFAALLAFLAAVLMIFRAFCILAA